EALGAEDLLRPRHVTARFDQRALAIHHSGAGRVAQLLDQPGRDLVIGHSSGPSFSLPSSRQPLAGDGVPSVSPPALAGSASSIRSRDSSSVRSPVSSSVRSSDAGVPDSPVSAASGSAFRAGSGAKSTCASTDSGSAGPLGSGSVRASSGRRSSGAAQLAPWSAGTGAGSAAGSAAGSVSGRGSVSDWV